MTPRTFTAQRGAVLVVGLILLAMIMLMAVSAYLMSTSNLKSVGNLQVRSEAIAAANNAIEQVINNTFAAAFSSPPQGGEIQVDIDNDGKTDYVVTYPAPTCVQASLAEDTTKSSLSLGTAFASGSTWNTIWDIDATVTDPATGASARVHMGVRILLNETQKTNACL